MIAAVSLIDVTDACTGGRGAQVPPMVVVPSLVLLAAMGATACVAADIGLSTG
jgi:hypothetical protein